MLCEVVKKNGRVLLVVDGNVIDPIAYMTYNPNEDNYSKFSEIGTKLFSFGVYVGDQGINIESGIKPFRSGYFKGYDNYNFKEVSSDFEKITAFNEKAYIIPRVYLDCPIWWENENIEELAEDAKGQKVRQSYASKKWRNDSLKALYTFIDYINNSKWKDNVIGYQVAAGGTEEWQYHHKYANQYCDYSRCNLANYIEWLKKKYLKITNLNEGWNSDYTSFEEIQFPTPFERAYTLNGVLRDPVKEMHVIDYYTYHNHLMADTIQFFCKNIKEYTNGERITGAFYGYVCEIINHNLGHHAMHEIINSNYIDFFASPNSYMKQRSAGIDWPYMSVVDSARLHGKLWFVESDTRTSLTGSLREALPHAAPNNSRYSLQGVWKGPDNTLSLSLLIKGFGRILTGQIGTWWFDMWGGWYNDPMYMDFIKKSIELMHESIEENIKTNCEIAVFIDSRSFSYYRVNDNALYELIYNQRESLGLIGAPYHIYLTDDITSDHFNSEKHKLFIFLNSVVITEKTKIAITRKLKKKGKTILWVYLEDYNVDKSITDFTIKYSKDSKPIQAEYANTVFPSSCVQCPELSPEDLINSRVIARQRDTNLPVCAIKCFDYNSIYCTVPGLSTKLLMDIADLSGVHIYSYTQDVIYADSKYIFIHARTAGEKRIFLPCSAEVYDALTNQLVSDACAFFDFTLDQYETRAFRILS